MTSLRTTLTARDVMVHEPVCVDPATTLPELARIFEENGISGVPVCAADGRVIGIVSKTDLIRRCMEGTLDLPPAYLFEVIFEQGGEDTAEALPEVHSTVEDVMTEDPVTVPPDAAIDEIARLMCDVGIHRVVVVDGDDLPLGIITSLDLLGVFSG